ncbi:MAG: hydrogenase expression protein [Chloroflexi bacterium]|nr:hydrogenase expression protein [Chloroflexota bacterium]
MRTGKLPPELLAQLLGRIPRTDPRVVLGSGIGEDAAAIDFLAAPAGSAGGSMAGGVAGGVFADERGERLLIAKTDPITFATDLIGWYAVHVNANDVVCMGATPRWFLASALLPERWTEADVSTLFDQLLAACKEIGASLVGGHTEVTAGLDRPIVAGCMLGEAARDQLVRTGGGQPGDTLLLTQGVAIEGTAVLAREAAEQLARAGMAREAIERAQRFLFEPGISVVAAAQALREALPAGALHSLHDPTEGGLSAGVWEVAEASGCGGVVESGAIRIFPETSHVCDALGLDPLGLLASGALLAAVAPRAAATAVDALGRKGIPVAAIGRLTPREEGLRLREPDGLLRDWPRFDRDEVARHFDRVPGS